MAKYLITLNYTVHGKHKTVWVENYPVITAGYALNRYLYKYDNFAPIENEKYLDRMNRFLTASDKDNDKIEIIEQNDKLILGNNLWQWCFSPKWDKLAKKEKEATLAERETGQRILWFLDFGLPANWKDQMEGKEKYISQDYTGLKDFEGKAIIAADKPAHTDN